MKFLDRMIRAIEANSRHNERRKLVDELQDIYLKQDYTPAVDQRAAWIVSRLNELGRADLNDYLTRDKPLKSVSQRIKEDDCGVPEGLVGEWKAPV